MEIFVKKGDILASEADLLVVGAYEGGDWDNDFMSRLNTLLGGKFKKLAQAQDFTGRVGQSLLFPAPDKMSVEYVFVVGLGKAGHSLKNTAREAAGNVVQTAKKLGLATVALEMFGEDDEVHFHARSFAQAISEALLLADYTFETYKKKSKKSSLKEVTIVAENGRDANTAEKGVKEAISTIKGVILARDLVNTPAKDMTPTRLAEAAQDIAKSSRGAVRVRVYDREQCEKKNMGSYLAVAQGSEEEPKFIHLIYKPKKVKKKIALVGKGITFDSGGLSLKAASHMETMKCDMAGAAAILGVFASLSALRPQLEIHGIIAATENLPSGRAIKPGDVVRASNGKSIEILNTDAEGRLTLADALHYAAKQKPDYIIDLATLTGACMVALGEEIAGVMSNNPKFANQVLNASAEAGEKMWELPLEKRYRKLLESDVADLRNIATTSYGGSLTAGLFLQEFVPEGTPWVHIDIAGPAFAERPIASYLGKGGTGFGVRTLVNLLGSL
ncbi:leucyl aminopeptidase [Patescibacteria group bacterium]|nr:leucyl aminopeptidase [Patescibacteria group bacterium]